jgi:hypothetical protein
MSFISGFSLQGDWLCRDPGRTLLPGPGGKAPGPLTAVGIQFQAGPLLDLHGGQRRTSFSHQTPHLITRSYLLKPGPAQDRAGYETEDPSPQSTVSFPQGHFKHMCEVKLDFLKWQMLGSYVSSPLYKTETQGYFQSHVPPVMG